MSKIALLPGGFKPPHAGHYNMAKWLADKTGATVLIRVGAKEREGITREMSLKLWELYTQDDNNIIVKPSNSNSPVQDVYDFIEQEATKGSTVYLGMGEKDADDKRFANIGKFAKPKGINFETTLVPPQAGGVSGTQMREFIKNNNKKLFQKYLPNHIDKEKAWSIVTNLEEDLSVFSKKWWKDNLDLEEPYGDTTSYRDHWKSNDPGPKPPVEPAYKYKRGGLYGRMYENHTTSTALINDVPVPLETMNTPEQQMQGMIGRDSLKGGMLFPYDRVQRRDFHMQGCKIPLDIIFINNSKINNIHHNCPPCKQNNCPKYSGMADNVLELPGGYCKKNNINIGDKINLNINPNIPQPEIKNNSLVKEWFKNIINEILLTEGGAAGHMAHPFNLPNVNSGKDLKDIFEKSSESLNKNPGSVKIDGVNSSIRLVDLDGQKQFVMDRGSKKPLDIKGITKADLEDRFKPGHGMVKVGGEVLDMFNEALPSLEADLKKLGAWDDPNILFNMEYVSGKTNVQDYGSNFIAIHGLNKIESKEVQGKRQMLVKRSSSEVSYDKSALQSLLDNLAPIAKKNDFEVYGSVPTEVKGKPNFGSALSKTYTIKSNKGNKTQSLDKWLSELNNIPEEDFIFMNVNGTKKKVGAVSKQVYITLLKGDNIDELYEDEEDKKKAIEGFTTYLATEKLGDEVLKVLDSPMGSVENHEGVVIRDEKIANVPFKITGKFILGGMVSDF